MTNTQSVLVKPFVRIQLSNCIPGTYTLMDLEDYMKYIYQKVKAGKFYCDRAISLKSNGYATISLKKKDGRFYRLLLHRLINACPKGLVVDHKSRDRLDNRKINLENTTTYLNNLNRGRYTELYNSVRIRRPIRGVFEIVRQYDSVFYGSI